MWLLITFVVIIAVAIAYEWRDDIKKWWDSTDQ